MYIHKQGRVRYKTLCGSDVPARAIHTNSQGVTCPNCVALLEEKSFLDIEEALRRIFYPPNYYDLQELVPPVVRDAKLQKRMGYLEMINHYPSFPAYVYNAMPSEEAKKYKKT